LSFQRESERSLRSSPARERCTRYAVICFRERSSSNGPGVPAPSDAPFADDLAREKIQHGAGVDVPPPTRSELFREPDEAAAAALTATRLQVLIDVLSSRRAKNVTRLERKRNRHSHGAHPSGG
jgi:hypothetical protein